MQKMTTKIYHIDPCPAPRQNRSDKWKKRPAVLRYRAFRDEVRLHKIQINPFGDHIVFNIPMPKSWSKKKKIAMLGKPHRQKPDLDNLLKALLDAVFAEDCGIWDISATKYWNTRGMIIIKETENGA